MTADKLKVEWTIRGYLLPNYKVYAHGPNGFYRYAHGPAFSRRSAEDRINKLVAEWRREVAA